MVDSTSRAPSSAQSIASSPANSSVIIRRWLATWVDFLALGAGFFAAAMIFGGKSPGIAVSIWLVAAVLYYPVMEWRWGRTLGKFVTGISVVDTLGNYPSLTKAVLRTLTRLIEVNPFLLGGIPAGIFAWFSKTRQRLGDRLAGTYVIPSKRVAEARSAGGISVEALTVFD